MGRLIPAGTGLSQYKQLDLEVESPTDEITQVEAALAASHGDAGALPPLDVSSGDVLPSAASRAPGAA